MNAFKNVQFYGLHILSHFEILFIKYERVCLTLPKASHISATEYLILIAI